MKKTIKILVGKLDQLQEKSDGTLQGGFAAIKGGFKAFDDSTNDGVRCTNSSDCTHSTNIVNCTNSGTCFV